MKFNKKILVSLLAVGMLFSITLSNAIKANEVEGEVTETEEINANQSEEIVSTMSLTAIDSAFTPASQQLHDAILAKYPAINTDTDGSSGYISKSEAAAWVGESIVLYDRGLTGTIDGIEYFTNPALKTIFLYNNQLSGSIPSGLFDLPALDALRLDSNQFTGEIPSNIGNLTTLTSLFMSGNSLEGPIPTSIGNLTGLTRLHLNDNQLSGTIPSGIGNMNQLIYLYLQTNQLTGGIPSSFSGLDSIVRLYLGKNQLSGEIPSFIGELSTLQYLRLHENNLSGEIPESIYSLPNISKLEVQGNKELTGNPAEGFANNSTIAHLDVSGTNVIQAKPNAPLLTDDMFMYDNLAEALLNADGSLKDEVTQADIERAKESADYWSEPTKSEWKANIDIAQELLYQRDAETAVNDLFNPDGIIKETVTQDDIEDAQDLVDRITDTDKKQELQDKLDDAQKQLEERSFAVLEGFKTFAGTGTVSTKIDAPVEKFSKVYVDGKLLPSSNYVVTSGSTIITLNENYLKTLANGTYNVEVEFVSGAKVSVPLTIDVKTITDPTDPVDPVDPTDPTKPVEPTDPTTPTKPTNPSVDVPTVSKPSVDPSISSSTNGSNVNTGDTTNMIMLYGMLAISILGIAVISKRRKVEK